jgi:hypothetical protein
MTYALFRCVFCDHPVNVGESGVMKQVLCWVKSANNTSPKGIESQHRYAHAVCLETEMHGKPQQAETLF